MRFAPFIYFTIVAVVMSSASENVNASSSATVGGSISAAFIHPQQPAAASASRPAQNDESSQVDTEQQQGSNEVPLLPAADPDSDIPSIKLGEVMRFEEMGPIIINLDGTTRRIENWDEMTERERQVTWRRISKRNEERRKLLMEKMELQNGDDTQKEEDL